jgi:molecular chaperone DnaK (HSP70)
MQRVGLKWQDLSRLIFVGGSCNLPVVRQRLTAAAQRANAGSLQICWQRIAATDRVLDPRYAVCLGAALAADGAGTLPPRREVGLRQYKVAVDPFAAFNDPRPTDGEKPE